MPSVDVEARCVVCDDPFVIPAFTRGRQPTKCLRHRGKPRSGSATAFARVNGRPEPEPEVDPVSVGVLLRTTDLQRLDKLANAVTPSRQAFRDAMNGLRGTVTPEAYELLAALSLAAARLLRGSRAGAPSA